MMRAFCIKSRSPNPIVVAQNKDRVERETIETGFAIEACCAREQPDEHGLLLCRERNTALLQHVDHRDGFKNRERQEAHDAQIVAAQCNLRRIAVGAGNLDRRAMPLFLAYRGRQMDLITPEQLGCIQFP